jgi:MFS family permease
VSAGFIALYAVAFMGTCLVLIAPLLVTLALKVNSLVGIDAAPRQLSVVTGVGALVAVFGNPWLGRLSDRTTSSLGMRRPWIVAGLVGGSLGVLVVATAPSVPVVLAGWCVAQLFFNGLLAAMAAVLPDQVPLAQRGLVAGVLGVCVPVASVGGTYVVQLFDGHELAMFLAPCAIGAAMVAPFAIHLDDRRLSPGDRPPWSLREFLATFYVDPRRNADFTWAFCSRFLFVTAYAFLVTYQAYFLIEHLGSDADDVPHLVFVSTLVQSSVVVAASVLSGRLSDRTGRRKVFVSAAAVVYATALLWVATSSSYDVFLVGMALAGSGSGCTSPSTWRSSPTCSRTTPARRRTWASSTWRAPCRSRWLPRWPRPS